jgi:hypothetical protein
VPNDSNQYSFDLKLVRWLHHDRLHRRIGRMQFDVRLSLDVGLDRGFAIDQRHDRLPVPRCVLFPHDHKIAGKNSFILHRFSLHAERKGFAAPQHAGRDIDQF